MSVTELCSRCSSDRFRKRRTSTNFSEMGRMIRGSAMKRSGNGAYRPSPSRRGRTRRSGSTGIRKETVMCGTRIFGRSGRRDDRSGKKRADITVGVYRKRRCSETRLSSVHGIGTDIRKSAYLASHPIESAQSDNDARYAGKLHCCINPRYERGDPVRVRELFNKAVREYEKTNQRFGQHIETKNL